MSYLKLSSDFLVDAGKALSEYKETHKEEKLRKACEKGFGAFVQVLKYYKGRAIRHKDFRKVVEELYLKTSNRDKAHMAAENLHGAFYDGTLSYVEVEFALQQIARGTQAITELK